MNKRVAYIDFAKFIGLCLVIYGHVPPTDNIGHVIIYSFHMPLFFLLSGVFFDISRFSLSKNIKSLLIPYVVFTIFLVFLKSVVSYLLSGKLGGQIIISELIGILLGSTDPEAPYQVIGGASWFLIALFIIRINAMFILTQDKYLQIFIVTGELLAIFLLQRVIMWFPLSIDSAVLGTPFFIVGFYLKRIVTEKIPNTRLRVIYILLLGGIVGLSPYNGLVNMCAGSYGNHYVLFFFFGIAGTLFILYISACLKKQPPFVAQIVRGAPLVICTHLWILEYLYLAYRLILHRKLLNPIPFVWWEKVLFTAIIMLISYVLIKIINKFCPVIMGR